MAGSGECAKSGRVDFSTRDPVLLRQNTASQASGVAASHGERFPTLHVWVSPLIPTPVPWLPSKTSDSVDHEGSVTDTATPPGLVRPVAFAVGGLTV